eukprot:TRINITY_DN12597_c0_g2_i1.p1 TRINITY_DN12597_c0_g2~~TRINITY_DN12597_c0_g2_i1.p1  ORF type:complete len:255 (+),score=61.22 TRINITY_DN12597_c0_g2_i1:42-806(+)
MTSDEDMQETAKGFCFAITSSVAALYFFVYVVFIHETTEKRVLRLAIDVLQSHSQSLSAEYQSLQSKSADLTNRYACISKRHSATALHLKDLQKQLALESKYRSVQHAINNEHMCKIEALKTEIELVAGEARLQRRLRSKLESKLHHLTSAVEHVKYPTLPLEKMAMNSHELPRRDSSKTVSSEGTLASQHSLASTVGYRTSPPFSEITMTDDWRRRSNDSSDLISGDEYLNSPPHRPPYSLEKDKVSGLPYSE